LGKARSTLASVQAEIHHELMAEEMRQLAQEHLDSDELKQTIHDSEAALRDIEDAMQAMPHAKADVDDDKPA
jgi:hypothetical protein